MEKFFSQFSFHPVIEFPKEYEVFDFSCGYDSKRELAHKYGVGKYNEKRPNMYVSELYKDQRDIHMGIDLMAPLGTEIKAFYEGEVFLFANNDRELDYGYTLITKHHLADKTLYALHGHLSQKSLVNKKVGDSFQAGDTIAWIGSKEENGGWNPHLHFQISWQEPKIADMPGVVHSSDHEEALRIYPDPQLILGKLYD